MAKNGVILARISNRYNRWSKRRIWQRIFEKMAAAGPVPEELYRYQSRQSGIARRLAQKGGVRGSDWALARRKNKQNPCFVAFALTPRDVTDITMANSGLLGAIDKSQTLLADKAYDANSLRHGSSDER